MLVVLMGLGLGMEMFLFTPGHGLAHAQDQIDFCTYSQDSLSEGTDEREEETSMADLGPEGFKALINPTIENILQKKRIATSADCHSHAPLNFGILTNNPYFQIYRSSGLGKRGLAELEEHLQGNEHPERLPSSVIYMNQYAYGTAKDNFTNYLARKIKGQIQGPLYSYYPFAKEQERLKKFPQSGKKFQFFHPAGGPHQNVYLHGGNPLSDLLSIKNFTGLSIDPSLNKTPIYTRGGRDALYHVLEKILSAEGPVLFHCKAGCHRTGMIGLAIRYLQGGPWTQNLKDGSQENPDENLSVKIKVHGKKLRNFIPANAAQYEYYLHNPYNFRPDNLEAITALTQDSRFQCLQEKFRPYLNQGDESREKKCFETVHDLDEGSKETPKEASVTPGLVPPSDFPSYAKAAVKECQQRFQMETDIKMKLDYLEATLKSKTSKIRIDEDGELTAMLKWEAPGLFNHKERQAKNDLRLSETAMKIKELMNKISQYEESSKTPALEFNQRYFSIINKLRREDPRLRPFLE